MQEGSLPPNVPMLENYGLATAEFFYGMPDFPLILQIYIWQEYDMAPEFPRITKLVRYWHKNLEGPLYLVRIDHVKLIAPREIEFIKLNPKLALN